MTEILKGKSMRVALRMDKLDRRGNLCVGQDPIFFREAGMPPEEFALKFAELLRTNPSICHDEQGRFDGNARVLALILDADPEMFKGRGLEIDRGISYEPRLITATEAGEGKLAQVRIGDNQHGRSYFFRVAEEGLKYLPFAENCGVGTVQQGERAFAPGWNVGSESPIWPWVAFYPERFERLRDFVKILKPGDTNPLTGLISEEKSSSVRTLAKQIAEKLDGAGKDWARDIVDSL